MRVTLLCVCASLMISLCTAQVAKQPKLAWWDFSKQSSMVAAERISGKMFTIISNFAKPEYVKGIDGDGLRLDGYSTCVEGALNTSVQAPFSVTGWFALETFPTDTAGFFAIADKDGRNSISAAVDQTGRLMIGTGVGGKWKYTQAGSSLEKFKWIHIALSVSPSKVELYANAEKIGDLEFKGIGINMSNVVLGRDQRIKRTYNYFPVTAINGLIDEVVIWRDALSQKEIKALYTSYDSDVKPVLAIPSIRFADDFNRPKYHLLPGANWTNETHGLIHYKGRYHIFNQKNGTNLFLGQINWGHFSSTDLIHWTEHKPSLEPEAGYDKKGIWSGHVVIDDSGKAAIMYTGGSGSHTTMNLAYPKDDVLVEWEKYEGNPVVAKAPDGFERTDMRDPYLWKEGSDWYMIIGYGIKEAGVEKGALLLYKSGDLQNWKFVHPFFIGNPDKDDSGIFWEMPVFWKLDGKYILLVNKVPQPAKPAVALYWTGDFINEKFVPDHEVPKKLEVINRMLSPSVTLDEKGRTVAIAIIPDETSAEAQLKQGWTHLYSIPRMWSLRNGKLCQSPLPELALLRDHHQKIESQVLSDNHHAQLPNTNHQAEVSVKLKPIDAKRFGFIMAKNADGSEQTKISFDVELQKVFVDATKSTKRQFIPVDIREGSFAIRPGDEVEIHIFIDGSVVEVFINNEEAFTTRVFPQDASSTGIEIFSEGGSLELSDGDIWSLKSSENNLDY